VAIPLDTFRRVSNGEYDMHLLVGSLFVIVLCLVAAINNLVWLQRKHTNVKMMYGPTFDEVDEESEPMVK